MEIVSEHIAQQLSGREFCLLFEDELERYWPSEKSAGTEREKKVEAFARSRGWTASVLEGDFGTRAIFRKQKP